MSTHRPNSFLPHGKGALHLLFPTPRTFPPLPFPVFARLTLLTLQISDESIGESLYGQLYLKGLRYLTFKGGA